ncbi:MAG: peptidase M3, partial [Bacteroidales bacterium]|nr:peptidase M3 [Bacteroidales bacterium]
MKDTGNPFFSEYSTPFQVPPFDLIEEVHFLPAYEKAIALQKQEIDDIINNPEEPGFVNTIEALDHSGGLLTRVENVFSNRRSVNTNDELNAIAEKVAPMVSAHRDDISLNPDLFKRVKALNEQKDDLGLNKEQTSLLEKIYKNFVRGGANLNDDDKDKLREINSKLSVLTLKFGNNVLAETNEYKMYIENQEDL